MKTTGTTKQQASEAARRHRAQQAADGFEVKKPAPAAASGVALDRRAQRNLSNLAGTSNFSSANLPPVGGAPVKQSTPVDKSRATDPVDVQAEIQDGLITRTDALTAANESVEKAEAKLAEHLTHLKDVLTPEQLQAYADDFRADNAAAYDAVEAAATDLAGYLAEKAAPLAEAEAQIQAEHRVPAIYQADITVEYLEKAAAALETSVTLSPSGSSGLVDALSSVAMAGEAVGGALADFGGRVGAFAEAAGKAFGGVGAALDLGANVGRILEDGGRVEHWAGAAAGAVVVAEIAGVAVTAPVSMLAGAVAVAAGGVSAYRDNQERVAEMSGRLVELGFDASHADNIARANPAALAVLGAAGYSPGELQQLTTQARFTLVNANHTEAEFFVAAMAQLGVSPADATQLLLDAGGAASKLVGYVADARATSDRTRADLLRALRVPDPATESVRELLFRTLG